MFSGLQNYLSSFLQTRDQVEADNLRCENRMGELKRDFGFLSLRRIVLFQREKHFTTLPLVGLCKEGLKYDKTLGLEGLHCRPASVLESDL